MRQRHGKLKSNMRTELTSMTKNTIQHEFMTWQIFGGNEVQQPMMSKMAKPAMPKCCGGGGDKSAWRSSSWMKRVEWPRAIAPNDLSFGRRSFIERSNGWNT